MNEKLRAFAEKNALTLRKNGCYGQLFGYQAGLYINRFANPQYVLCISAHTAEAAEQIRSFLKKKKDDLKLTGFDVLGVGVILFPALYFSVYEQIEKIFKTVADFLKSKNVAGGDTCPYCGAKMTEKTLVSDGGHCFYVHEACFNANLQLVKEAEKEEKSSPDRYGRGFLGAVLGALIGALAFVGLFAWGYLEVIAPVVGVVAAHYLYGALGGKPSVKKIVTVGAVCLAFTLAAFFACYFVQIALSKPEAGLFAELKRLFAEKEGYASRFIVTLVFSCVAVGVGLVYSVYATLKSLRRPTEDLKKIS